MPEFRLQFPLEQVPEYAARYPYEDDVEALGVGRAARDRGYYTREELLKQNLKTAARAVFRILLGGLD